MAWVLRVTLTNEDEDKGYRFSEWDEPLADTWFESLDEAGLPIMGRIYKECQREYGRCTGSVYVDQETGGPRKVGWFFLKRERYEDMNELYLRGAWVTVTDKIETPTRWEYAS